MDIKTLVERAKTKDSHALETLYNMYYPKMLGLCIKITKEDEDSKDLVHDAFILAFSSLSNLNSPQKFSEWLSTIVRNVALKYIEKKRKIRFVSINNEDEAVATIDVSSDSTMNIQDILNLIDKLPTGYGKIIRLYAIDGFSHKEIAAILGIEPHSSSSQLSRAKAMLRKMIARSLWAVVLLLIISIPIYIHLLHKKPLQSQKSEIAEYDIRQRDKDGNETSNLVKDGIEIRKPVYKEMSVSKVIDEIPNTLLVSDTCCKEISVPDVEEVEHHQDSTTQQIILSDEDVAIENQKKKTNKWYMLATGSVGSALVQNIYKFIVISNGDIGSGTPTTPENVHTWEKLSGYLHSIEHENMPTDTLAIMEIADHNQGDIVEHEHHDSPIAFAISLSKPLSERWSIESGLQYSILKSRSTMGGNDYYIGKEQKIHYLGIPIRISYRLADYKRLSAYGTTGISLNIPVYGKINSKYVVAHTSAYTDSWHITSSLQWSTNFTLGLQYQILPKLTLYVEPTLYLYIPNGSSTHTIWTEHPFTFSAPFGIRFMW